jgi:hypothetical protein
VGSNPTPSANDNRMIRLATFKANISEVIEDRSAFAGGKVEFTDTPRRAAIPDITPRETAWVPNSVAMPT